MLGQLFSSAIDGATRGLCTMGLYTFGGYVYSEQFEQPALFYAVPIVKGISMSYRDGDDAYEKAQQVVGTVSAIFAAAALGSLRNARFGSRACTLLAGLTLGGAIVGIPTVALTGSIGAACVAGTLISLIVSQVPVNTEE